MPSTGFHDIQSSAVEVPRAKHVAYLNFTNSSNDFTNLHPSPPSYHPAVTPRNDSTPLSSFPPTPTSQTLAVPTGKVRPPPSKQLDDIRKLTESVHFRNGEYVFLVVKEWWDHWVTCCKNNITDVPEINNWSLIDMSQDQSEKPTSEPDFTQDATYKTRYALRKDVKPDIDFKILNMEAWAALHSWYTGGPPLPRLVTHTYAEASTVRTDLYSSLMTATSPPQVDLWSQPPPCLADTVSRDRRDHSSDCYAINERTDGSAKLAPPQIVRVKSFNFNDCGMSVTEASDHETPAYSSSSSSFDTAPPTYSGDNDRGSTDLDTDMLSDSTVPVDTPSGSSTRVPRHVSLTQINTCFVCRAVALQRCTQCSAVYYCGIPCQRSHWKYHKKWCALAKQHSALPTAEFARVVPVGRRGQVGLHNLGNSCYLNSSLQCLSHLLPLTTYFLSDRYKQELNTASLDGTGGRLAVEYATLMQELWFESKPAVSAAGLKSLLGKLRPEYAGYQQHDAHEVIELLLDKLHEDLNRVVKKPYVERPEGDGTNDAAVAADAWSKHLLRENSVVTELVGSQMRSQLTCPDCGKVSVCFEYQQTLQVAIPRVSIIKTLLINYVPNEIPKVFTRSISNTPYGSSKLLQYKLLVMRPVQLAVQLDPMQQLGVAVKKVSDAMKQYSVTIETEVKQALAEVQRYDKQAGANTDTISVFINSPLELYKSSEIVLFEMAAAPHTNKPNMLQNFIEVERPVIRLPDDITIAAYNIPTSSTNNILLLQRKVDYNALNSLVASLGSRLPTLSQVESAFAVVGTPLILPCDPKWTCGKVRHYVWQYVSRVLVTDPMFIVAQGATGEVIRQAAAVIQEAEAKTDIKQQLFFSRLLPIRMVDQSGRPAHSSYWKQLYNGMARSSPRAGPTTAAETSFVTHLDGPRSTTSGLLAHDTFLGASVPDDKNITLAQFFGNDEEFYTLSVDWCGNWLQLLSEGELKATSNHDSCSLLQASSRSSSSSTGNLTLERCLEEHTREETLDEVNGWYCSNCNTHKCARKNVTFWAPSLPTVLIVVLKRFEFKDLGTTFGRSMTTHREKIDAFVDFPINGLDLTRFCGNSSSDGDSSNGERNSRSVYDLFAVCNHFGRMGFGHYTAYARDWKAETLSDTWMSFDDNDVEKCKDQASVVSRAAYILMYRRRP